MTDVKITQLPQAALPLFGTEVFPLVQNGVTVQAPVGSIGYVSTISNLRSTTPVNNVSVEVEGYYTKNDGGGGLFYAVAGATAGTYVDNGGTIIVPTGGDGSSAWLRIYSGEINVKWFGAKGDGSSNDTLALRAACAAGTQIYFPPGDYVIVMTASNRFDVLGSWDSKTNVSVTGGEARILDNTVYIGNDPFISIFQFKACKGAVVAGVEYVGLPLSNVVLNSQIGATFVNIYGECELIDIKARITHARYGIRAGSYFDPAEGGASQVSVDVNCKDVGYPIATHLTDQLTGTIYADTPHRACYVAGTRGGNLLVKFKNQLAANEICLLTDATLVYRPPGDNTITHVTGGGRGCSDLTLTAIDMGSPITELASCATGINLSWGNPETYFKNLTFNFDVKADDVNSSKVSGFKLLAEEPVSLYPNFLRSNNQFCYYQNIKVSGVIDRSNQTIVGSSANEIFVDTYDNVSMTGANVSNLVFENVIYRHGSFPTKPTMQIYTQGATGPVILNNCQLDASLILSASSTYPAIIEDSKIHNLIRGGRLYASNSVVDTYVPGLFSNTFSVSDCTFGSFFQKTQISAAELTLTGASVAFGAFPANVIILNVTGVVTDTITGASGFQVGISGATTRYADISATAIGTTFNIADYAIAETSPRYNRTSANLIVTAKTSNFTGGKIKILVTYIQFAAPN